MNEKNKKSLKNTLMQMNIMPVVSFPKIKRWFVNNIIYDKYIMLTKVINLTSPSFKQLFFLFSSTNHQPESFKHILE